MTRHPVTLEPIEPDCDWCDTRAEAWRLQRDDMEHASAACEAGSDECELLADAANAAHEAANFLRLASKAIAKRQAQQRAVAA